jgi:hypothetical protein
MKKVSTLERNKKAADQIRKAAWKVFSFQSSVYSILF